MFAWLKEIQVFTGIFREIYIKLYRVALQGIMKQKVSYNKMDTTCSIVCHENLLLLCAFELYFAKYGI